MRTSPLKTAICSLSLLLVGTTPVIGVHAAGSFTEYTDKASFVAALTSPTIIDFDSLPASGTIAGNEFAAQGVTITQLDHNPINVVSAPPIPTSYSNVVFGSGTNVLSSTYSDHDQPGYSLACCSVYFNDAFSDNIRFTFATGATAAGLYVGENDVNDVTIRFLDRDGVLITERTFLKSTPYNVYYGIVSDTVIGSIELVEPANDLDGVVVDDLVFTPFAQHETGDDTPPVVTTNPNATCIGPPNHKYQTINLSDFITSVTDEDPTVDINDVYITRVSSDEAQDAPGNGDGNTLDDMVIAPDCKSVQLRAERQGAGDGRVYTVEFAVSDSSGNTTTGSYQIIVPHDGSGCRAVVSQGGYSVTSNCQVPST
jgi:hypothetical protein